MTADLKEENSSGLLRRMIVVARRLFMPVALAFLVFAAYSARDVISQILAQARPGILILAIFGCSALSLILPLVTWTVLRGMGNTISYRTVLRVYVDRLPARYLPGGIWQTVSRMVDLHALGMNRGQLSFLVLIENLGSLAIALIAGGTFLLLAGSAELSATMFVAGGVLLAVGLPWISNRFVGLARIPRMTYLVALAIMAMFWLIAATLFSIYWLAFPSLSLEGNVLNIYAAYLLAWAAGFVAVFAPQGIGIFEGVAGSMLKGDLSITGMAALVAGFRIVVLSGDVVAYMIGRLIRWARHTKPS